MQKTKLRSSWARALRAPVVGVAAVGLIAAAPAAASASPAAPPTLVSNPASLVNTFIGTSNGGDTFPGADVPLGMVQWGPDTPSRPSGGGYSYGDSAITGYSLTHMSGPGCGAEGDVPILPTVGAVGANPSAATEPLNHADESATPGSYRLTSGGVQTQLTTTTRSGMGKFTFPSTTSANLLFKLSGSQAGATATHFQVISNTEVAGWVTSGNFCGAPNKYTLHFDMVFNHPFTGYGTWTNGSAPAAGSKSLTTHLSAATKARLEQAEATKARTAMSAASQPGAATSPAGKARAAATTASQPPVSADGAYVSFNTTGHPVVAAKVGISYVSTANAVLNRNRENAGWNFNQVQAAAHRSWNAMLNKIQVGGGSPAEQSIFYTGMYHSLLHPNIFSDVNRQYMGADGQIHQAPAGHAFYANYSGWDIYRSAIQLQALLAPQQTSDMVTSMLDIYNQTGMLPKWSENNGEAYIMVGDPADPIITGAYAFGARGFDAKQALTDMQTEANVPNNIRPGLNYYENDGYLPIDGSYGCCNYYGPVSTGEEYNAADNSIAELARALGKPSVAATFATRAQSWQNSYNPGSGFLQPKQVNGAFQPGFNPTSGNGFVEADAYVYTAMLPFDVKGLIAAEGGNAAWINYLDQMTSSVTDMGATKVQMGNEPSFDIPWEYDYAGAPYKTQQVVRETQTQLYTNTPGGLAGNDDLGAMSSWYVWSALGAYPETPGSATVALGSPLFPRIVIHLADGKTITENAPAASDGAPYVHNLTMNGTPSDRAFLPGGIFTHGATLNWTLATTPDTTWASAPGDAPPSSTAGLLPALGYLGGTSGGPVVNPGSTTTLQLGVQSMITSRQDVSWTATPAAGSGLVVGPTSGTIIVGSEAKATQAVSVSVPAGTADGQYLVTFQLRTATGTRLPNVVAQIGVARPGDLAPYYNNTGISNDTNQAAANFDSDGFSYSQQALTAAGLPPGAAVTSTGVHYIWPKAAAGQPDNVIAGGQTITVLPVSGATTLGVLGSATNGPSTGQMSITYTDGSTHTVALGLSDWTLGAGAEQPSYGNAIVATLPYRNSTGGTSQIIKTYVFSANVPLSAGKTVASVTLPSSANQGELHVFALGTDKGPLTTGS